MAWDLNMPSDLVLVRHGQSEANVFGAMAKQGDFSGRDALLAAKRHDSLVRLTDLGRSQARAAGRWVRDNLPPFDRFYVSQYIRTKETAAEMGLPNARWIADIMIRERDQGVQEGSGSSRVGLSDAEKERLARSSMYWSPIAGESLADVCSRVRHFLYALSQHSAGLRCVVVAHHQVINAFRLLLEDRVQEEFEGVLGEPMPNCAVFWYQRRTAEGRLTTRLEYGKKIEIRDDGATAKVEEFEVRRRQLTNNDLIAEVQKVKPLLDAKL